MNHQNELTCLHMATPWRAPRSESARYTRPDARFLAHLVATRANVAEYRLKNRILPENGAAAYRLSQAHPWPANPARQSISA